MPGIFPLHTVAYVGETVIYGIGLTVIVTLTGEPAQPLAIPVTEYVAVPATLILLFANAWAMLLPEPEVPPVMPLPMVGVAHE